jgi:hypothetical protein
MAHHSKFRGVVVALLAALGAAGCADEQEPLIVLNATSFEEGCVADPAAAALGLGQLDVSFGSPYILGLAVQNQLLSQTAQMSNSGIDDGELQLRTADVRLTSSQIPEVIDALDAQDAALVDFSVTLASNSIGPGDVQGVFVEVISRAASQAFAEQLGSLPAGSIPTVDAHVVVHGRRTGNSVGGVGDVEAREYTFPIRLCVGCLLTCSTCANGQCPTQINGFIGGACGNTQDIPWAPLGCEDPAEGV